MAEPNSHFHENHIISEPSQPPPYPPVLRHLHIFLFLAVLKNISRRFVESPIHAKSAVLLDFYAKVRPKFPLALPVAIESPYRPLLGIIHPHRPSIPPTSASSINIKKKKSKIFQYSQSLDKSRIREIFVSSFPIAFRNIQRRPLSS